MVTDEHMREHEREVGYCGGFDSQRAQATHETDDREADERASSQSGGGSTEVGRSGRWASGGERDTSTSGEGGEDDRAAEKSEPERVASNPSARRRDREADADEAAAGGGSRSSR
jgi:hypothetical protein